MWLPWGNSHLQLVDGMTLIKRRRKNFALMFSFTSNALRDGACFDYNTKKNKKWKTTETSLSFFLYSPESCVPTTAEHTKGPLEQNFLSSVTRGNPTGIFVKFEINLERWVRYISRGAISPAGADLLLVNDRLLFLKDWKKQTHFRERNLSSMMASIYFKQALWRKAKAHWYSICKHVLTFSTMVWKKQ